MLIGGVGAGGGVVVVDEGTRADQWKQVETGGQGTIC